MKKYYLIPWQGKEVAYHQALIDSGYERVWKPSDADFALIHFDREPWMSELGMDFNKPIFMYPHSPECFWHYDSDTDPSDRITCNFVTGDLVKAALVDLGYTRPVVVSGFPYCTPRRYQPTLGKKILFAPIHPDSDLLVDHDYIMANYRVHEILRGMKNDHEITVYHVGQAAENGLCTDGAIRYIQSDMALGNAMNMIEQADLVIAWQTLLHLACALGKPALTFNTDFPPHTVHRIYNSVAHPEIWHKYSFPVFLDITKARDPKILIREVTTGDHQTAMWRAGMTGKPFNAREFILHVKYYLGDQ